MEYLSLGYLFDMSERLYWGYMLSALVVAWLFFYKKPEVLKKQFSKEVLFHPSAKLDYLYFIITGVIKVALVLPLLIGAGDVTLWVLLQMQNYFGYTPRVIVEREWLMVGYTLTLFILSDLTRYWLHRIMHTIPILWRFHRVHHSAEVLNPITFYRIHPLENVLFGLRYALLTGLVTGIFVYYFGASVRMVEFLGANVLVFIFSIIGSNLRHSHIPLSYGKGFENWFISPYQHQLHHSKKYCHHNYGSFLAVWDRLFGTLVRGKKSNVVFGLPKEEVSHSIMGALFNPFIKGVKL